MGKRPPHPTPPRVATLEDIEPRVLFSADHPAALVAAAVGDGSSAHIRTLQAAAASTHAALQTTPAEQAGRELVFIDARVPDADALVRDIAAEAAAGRNIEVIRIAAGDDGIASITQALAGRSDVSAIHLIAHGSAGSTQLGDTSLDEDALLLRAGEIAGWGKALSADADLLLYGCDTGAGSTGAALVQGLAQLTGADVAASDDLTGFSGLGGNWRLEVQTGRIDAQLAIDPQMQAQWNNVLSTFTVTNTNDSGAGSLRQAITNANSNAGTDTISFNIGSGVQTITLASVLPSIDGTVLLDGTTQSGYTGAPLIVLDGNALNVDGLTLTANADGSTVRGLVVRNFGGAAINIAAGSDGNTIAGNYLGAVNAAGTAVGGANGSYTLFVAGANNTIGGSTAADRNVLGTSGTGGVYALLVTDATATGNQVLGNYIGIGADGATAFSGEQAGISVLSGAATTRIDGNVIAANNDNGVFISTTGTGTVVNNNRIGTNAAGTAVVSAPINGLWAQTAGANTVLTNNVIASAGQSGIRLDAGAGGVTVQGNRIGTDAAGTANWGMQRNGIQIASGNNLIGGTGGAQGNIIANSNQAASTFDGVAVSAGTGNAILGNSIYGTAAGTSGLGIDLGTTGVTSNDTGDADTGANNLQNFPLLTLATTNGSNQVNVSGTLNSTASSFYRIEFFASPSGSSDGRLYLGSANVSTNASGNATISATLSAAIPAGYLITATATNSNAAFNAFTDTSEFATSVAAISTVQNTLVVDTAADTLDGDTTSISTLLASKGADGFISLREAITAINNTPAGTLPTLVNFNIAGNVVHTITLGSLLPTITKPVIIDGTTDTGSVSANGGRPAIVINVNGLVGDGLRLDTGSGGSTIRGLVIQNYGAGADTSAIRIMAGSSGNTVAGNYLGDIGADGEQAAGKSSGDDGMWIQSANNIIGGSSAADRNVIGLDGRSDIVTYGILIDSGNGNQILGNYVGVNASGTTGFTGLQSGIWINTGSSANTRIENNLVSGAGDFGIAINTTGAGTQLLNNRIGINAAGTGLISTTAQTGIIVYVSGTGLVISGNWIGSTALAGISLQTGTSGITVQGNRIGTDLAGTANWGGQQSGIRVAGNNHLIGGTTAGQGNVVAFSNQQGTTADAITVSSGTGNAILGNSIYGTRSISGSLGIDLNPGGVTPNDPGDPDTGANNLQNFPVLTVATTNGSNLVTVSGTFNSTASSFFRIELFSNTSNSNSGYGEGKTYLGFVNVTTDASGNATFSSPLSVTLAAGAYISATATKATDGTYSSFTDTSEFAKSVVAISTVQNTLVVDTAADTVDGDTTSLSTLLASKGADGFISLREAITAINNTPASTLPTLINFNITGSGVHTITLGSALPTIDRPVVIDGTTDTASVTANGGRPAIVLNGNGAAINGLFLSANADGSTIRGLVITNLTGAGIIIDAGSDGNTIAGNYIGRVGANGQANALATNAGILVYGAGNTIGGSLAADRNILAGLAGEAISVSGAGAAGNVVQGNWVNVLPDGVTTVSSAGQGIVATNGATNTRIGGLNAGEGNWIVRTNFSAVGSMDATGTLVQGNRIGTDLAGTTNWGTTSAGMYFAGASTGALVQGNVVAFSGVNGGVLIDTGATGVAMLQNSIYGSAGLGLDLGFDGVTPNDPGDADTGPNNLQNFPVLTDVRTDGTGHVQVTGSINSTANTYIRIEVFANPGNDPSGHGQGQTSLGFIDVLTDGSGDASFSQTLNVTLAAGAFISATATRATDSSYTSFTDTSEFASNAVAISTVQNTLIVDTSDDTVDGDVTSLSTLLASKGADGRISLREAILAANNTANASLPTKINFGIAGTGVHTISLGTDLLIITAPVIIDGTTDDSFAANGNQPAIQLDGGNGTDESALVLRAGSSGSTIRGLAITGFHYSGIYIEPGSDNNTIVGNYLGSIGAGGQVLASTVQNGIWVDHSNNNRIGGTTAADRNVIAGVPENAILIDGADGTVVQGNWIGVTPDGLSAVSSPGQGISVVDGATNTQVGGLGAGEGNWIAKTDYSAIAVVGGSSDTIVQGNRIGTDAAGTANWGVGQSAGMYFASGANSNLVQGNVVAFSGANGGILLDADAGTGNAILGNQIYGNTGLGIDLGFDGVTPNDAGDADTGANNLQNFPVLTDVRTDGTGHVQVTGSINSTANTYIRIEVFANPGNDPSGHGQGQTSLGFIDVLTDGSGDASFSQTLNVTLAAGAFISATATRATDSSYTSFTDTSEFASNAVAISTVQNTLIVDTSDDTVDGDVTSLSTLLASKGADGRISLREAILAANNTANASLPTKINFGIAGTGVHTISLGTKLPSITAPVIIDATTDDSFAANGSRPAIVLQGPGASVVNSYGLNLQNGSDGSTIRGLDIQGFDIGIFIESSGGNTIAGNYIGALAPDGSLGASGTGNKWGIIIRSAGNTIGGTSAADRNVISGNGSANVVMDDAAAIGNSVVGNYIGTDALGAAGGNGGIDGIRITTGASNNQIGGASAAARNVLGGMSGNAISVDGVGTDGNVVQGNWIGVSPDGLSATVSPGDGILVSGGASNTQLGGLGAGEGNWIAKTAFSAIGVVGASGTIIQGNRIGTDASGTANWGVVNAAGMFFDGGASGSLVQGNVVAFSGANGGILLTSTAGTGNAILGNQIYGNAGLGLDLGFDGVTPNDPGDADTGANNLQNFPVLTDVRTDGTGHVQVTGSINSTANTYIRIEVFANPGNDPSGHGQGQTSLGFIDVLTDGSGDASFSQTLNVTLAAGAFISATATRATDSSYTSFTDTSEFASNAVAISTVQNTLIVDTSDDTVDGDVTSLSTLLASKGADGRISLREAILAANNTANASLPTKINFGIAGTGVHTISLGTALPSITAPVIIDATTDDSFAANGSRPAIVLQGPGGGNGVYLNTDSDGSTIRGLDIRGFDTGIFVSSGGNTIAGNYIGALGSDGSLGAAGTGNTWGTIIRSAGNTIGGTSAGDRNVISGNSSGNVVMDDAAATGNRVLGNTIGADASGAASGAGGNVGILISTGAAGNQIGGTAAGEGNLIAGNSGIGVSFAPTAGSGNAILSNIIRANGNLGIDLGQNGVTPNDPGDGDTGPNGLQNFPVLSSIGLSGGNFTVNGSFNSEANKTYRIEFFGIPYGSADGSGHGEADVYLGFIEVTTDGSGNAVINATLAVAGLSYGAYVTATATEKTGASSYGSTSEFAANVQTVNTAPVLTVPGSPAYTENGSAVVLAPGSTVLDTELNTAGDYGGATLTLLRNGGADADDVFGNSGLLGALTEGQAFTYNGVTVGAVTTNSGGTLVLSFNGSATQAVVNGVLSSISYRNVSEAPPASVQLDWSFSDGNSGAQGSGGALAGSGSTTVAITAVNDAPSGTNNTVTTLEDTAYVFTAGDFGFSDVDGNSLQAVRITTIPGAGSLTLNGVAVTAGQMVAVADIAAGNLKFTPAANANDAGYASFTFQVQDDGGTANGGVDTDPTPRTMTVNVTSVNDAPSGTNNTVTTLEDTAYTFSAADFGFSDVDGNALQGVKITTVPGAGSLTLNGVAVTAGQTVTVANIAAGNLKFTPAANANGAGYAAFTFQAQDDGGTANGGVDTDPTPRTMTVNVTSVNDAPAGANKTVTTLEDTAYVLTTADFGFSDVDGNALLAVNITTIPGAGSLTLNGVAVTAGQAISLADITAGNLKFTPAADANGAGYASFTFQVQDDGGTANGGVDTDPTPRTMTVNVTSVNDAPAGANKTVTTLEDSTYVFTTADFGFSDVDGNALLAVNITTIPGAGSLTLNGVAVTAGQAISLADITAGNLKFTPAANANGAGYASFTFQVQDDGGTANGGVDTDPTPRTMTVNVTSVNDAPSGTNKTVTTNEDTAYTFTVADFGFNDVDGNALLAVKITTAPGAGTLTLNGVAVTAGQSISVADITAGNLKFTPAANAHGTGYASFTFQVQDDGGTANGGVDTDPTPRTMTVNVTSVNDAPAGTNNTVTTNEDTAYIFNAADFGFSDAADGDALQAVKITTIPGAGSLTLNGVTVTAGQAITVADIAAGKLQFAPAANANGTGYASFTFQVQDDGGTANGGIDTDPTPRTMTVDVTSVDDAPTGTDRAVATHENTAHVFSVSDFGFSDVDGNALLAVKITTVPGAGSLTLNGVAVTAGQVVSAADVAAGDLVFTPAANASGTAYASFTFQVQDDGGTANGGVDTDPTPRTITINVTLVNSAPSGADKTITTNEDTVYTFSVGDFGFSDTDGNDLLAVKITTLPGAGSLSLNGVAVTAGQMVSAVDIAAGQLKFTPAANANGSAYASFTFQVQDDGGTANSGVDTDPTPRTMTVDVTSVNDAPSGTNNTITTNEDTAYVFTAADFGFSDAADGNTLLAVKITTMPGAGSLSLNGVAVTAGLMVSAADIAAGKLQFTPAANANGAGYASFTFQVQDDGGTANGGVDTDPTPRTMTVDVTAVNDAPSGTNNTVTTNEDTAYTFSAADFGFSDADGNALQGVKITTIPGAGSLSLSGVAVTAGQAVSIADIAAGNLKFTPAANANGTGYASFTFQVQDDGGTANSGVDTDPTPRTMTVDVTAVNDAPSGANNTVTTLEDTPYVFNATDFGFSDAADGNALLAVKVTTVPGAGALTLNGAAVTAGQMISAADIAAGKLQFTPAANANGAGYANFTFQVQDDGGTANGGIDTDPTPRTMTVSVNAVNDAPSGANNTVTTIEDTPYVFTAADFGFSDVDGNALLAVRITSIPGAGSLTLNGVALTAGQLVSAADIAAGNLKFTPVANANGSAYGSFGFQVQDDGGTAAGGVDTDPTARTMTVNVTPVNDAPAGTNNTVTTNEDTPYVFSAADFGFSDVDGNALLAVKITSVPGAGSLSLNGVAVTAGQMVSAADIAAGKLQFTPAANANGAGYASFGFQVQDDGGTANGGVDTDPTPRTMTVNVTPVNDAPSGANNTVTTNEDTPYIFTGADFGFSDVDGNALLAVKITNIPGAGSLTLNGVAVTAGQIVSAADVAAGKLQFAPSANANGSAYASFGFQVQDDGGTSAGGVDADPTVRTMTVNVMPVNDAPAGTSNTVTTNEDTPYVFSAVDFGFSDVDGNALLAVKITSVPGAGSLSLNGVAVTAGQMVSAADIAAGKLQFTPAANANGAGYASFGFQVQDNGGTANGGVDADPTPRTMTVNVTAVNDAPTGANNTVTTNRNTAYVFSAADFGYADVDAGDTLSAVRIDTLPGAGSLTLSGAAVTVGQVIAAADLGKLVFTPAADAIGDGYAGFTFSVRDSAGAYDASPKTLSVNVAAGNDAPQGTNGTVVTSADTPHTFATTDFGFTGADAGDTLSAVRIDTPPAAGVLSLGGVPVVAGQVISAADIAAGKLQFTPAGDGAGVSYASFRFSVRDQAGSYATAPSTITIDVMAVDDSPHITSPSTVTVAENNRPVTTLAVTDKDTPASSLVFSIAGGADAALFTIDPATGALSFINAPDFEHPQDARGQNTYAVTVQVSDGKSVARQDLTVAVLNVNDNAPVIRSNGGGATAVLDMTEGQRDVTIVNATDADAPLGSLSYSIMGGADAGLFRIDAQTGQLVFVKPPAYQAGDRNVYQVIVGVSDGTFVQQQSLEIVVARDSSSPPLIVRPQPPGLPRGPDPVIDIPTSVPIDTSDLSGNPPGRAPASLPSWAPHGWPGPGAGGLGDSGSWRTDEGSWQPGREPNARSAAVRLSEQGDAELTTWEAYLAAIGAQTSGRAMPDLRAAPSVDLPHGEEDFALNAALLTSLATAAGLLIWASRSGALITSLLMSAPAWRSYDLLPMLHRQARKERLAASQGDPDDEGPDSEPPQDSTSPPLPPDDSSPGGAARQPLQPVGEGTR